MAYPLHNLLSIQGDMYDGSDQVETWSVNLRLCGTLTTAPDPDDNDALATAISNWWTSTPMDSLTMTGYRILGFKHNAIGTDGNYETPESPNTYTYATPVDGYAAGTFHCPPQVALVATLVTPKVGKSYRGRIYVPCPGAALAGRFFVNSGIVGNLAVAVGSLIDDINEITSASNGTEVSIVSSKGFYNKVTGVKVGNVFDVQRRRAKSLYQTYSEVISVA